MERKIGWGLKRLQFSRTTASDVHSPLRQNNKLAALRRFVRPLHWLIAAEENGSKSQARDRCGQVARIRMQIYDCLPAHSRRAEPNFSPTLAAKFPSLDEPSKAGRVRRSPSDFFMATVIKPRHHFGSGGPVTEGGGGRIWVVRSGGEALARSNPELNRHRVSRVALPPSPDP